MREASPPAIIITGFMGAGKTTTAHALARRLSCRMIDLDCLIEEMAGRSPQAIIEQEGEPHFREIETRALRVALENKDARIIALGGGTWTISHNRTLIKEQGALTVWLDAPFALCWRRIAGEHNSRPLARDMERAERLYAERRTLYDLASLRIEVTEAKSAETIAAEIEEALPPLRFEEQTGQRKL